MKNRYPVKVTSLCIILSLLLLILNFTPIHLVKLNRFPNRGERYNPALVSQIRSVNDILSRADLIVSSKDDDSVYKIKYALALTELIKDRFYQGYSHYSLNEDWIAALLGATVWSHLSAIVLPDDILKYPMAACSQQAIVLMECLKRKGITYRKIGFDHHFASEAKIGNLWYYFDPNLEPDFSKIPRSSIESLIQRKALYSIYSKRFDSAQAAVLLAHQFYGKTNEKLAPQAAFFHTMTKFLSRTLFLFPLIFLYGYLKKFSSKAFDKQFMAAQPIAA